MKFVIDRKTWRRGGDVSSDFGLTQLLNNQGYMCCLGQVALQCNVPKEVILNKSWPGSVPLRYTDYRDLFSCNEFASDAMSINDNFLYSDAEREEQLIELFAEHGHELEFVQ